MIRLEEALEACNKDGKIDVKDLFVLLIESHEVQRGKEKAQSHNKA